MNTRFINARILTMEENCEIFIGELWVEGEKITYVGKSLDDEAVAKKGVKFDRTIDVKENLLMPGFKNAHTHSAMTGLRSYADDLPLQEWLETMIFPIEAKLDDEIAYEFVRLANLEYLTSGVTSIFDMYMFPDSTERACKDMGMRLTYCGDINKFGPSLEELENRFNRFNTNDPMRKYCMGFHAEYTCTKELLESISELAHKYKTPVYTHSSETAKEVKECIDRYGLTPTELFDSLGLYDFGGGGYHCVHMSDNDIEIFKKRNLSVISNPGSNTKLASGIAPISRFLEAGINVALGTDGPSSNNCLDMFREMFLVTGLAKLLDKDAASVPVKEVLKMATCNGAKAMFDNDCDTLSVGKYADIIMIDLYQPNMQPLNVIESNIVYSGSKMNVKMTMINGVIRYENGEFIGVDAMEIYKNANDMIKTLKSRL